MKKWGWLICLGLVAQIYSPYSNPYSNPYYNENREGNNNPYHQPNKEETVRNYLQVIGGLLNNLNSFQQHMQTQHYSNQATSKGYYQQGNRSGFQGNSFGR